MLADIKSNKNIMLKPMPINDKTGERKRVNMRTQFFKFNNPEPIIRNINGLKINSVRIAISNKWPDALLDETGPEISTITTAPKPGIIPNKRQVPRILTPLDLFFFIIPPSILLLYHLQYRK